jgi:chemotaxis protein methyltransferase CheR
MRLYTENYQKAGGKRAFSDYYTAAYGGALFERFLVENVTFADHSLATDSVFSEVHLVSCRNVLIYFNRALQDRALGLFRDALVRRGFLGLGNRETLSFNAHAGAFEDWCPA